MKKLLLAIALLTLSFPALAADTPKAFAPESAPESAYARVMRTGIVRCGYWNWAPLFTVDTKTGRMSGIFYDLMDDLGKELGLKIEWTKEVGFASFEQDLQTGKVDAVCAGVWPEAARSKVMSFSKAVFYVPLNIYVRADDRRFDGHTALLNNPAITFAGMDGWTEAEVVAHDFPKAKRTALPDINSPSEVFLMVKDKKADATIADIFTASTFMKNNPGSLRLVPAKDPIRYFGNTISTAKGERDLIDMLDTALDEAQSAGIIESLLEKYETVPHSLLRVAKPYEVSK